MSDEIKKAIEPQAKSIKELSKQMQQLLMTVENIERQQIEIKKKIESGNEAVSPLWEAAREIQHELQKAGAEAIKQIKEMNKESSTSFREVVISATVIFFVAMLAASVPVYYWRYVPPEVDYAQRIMYNQFYSDGKVGEEGTGIGLFESESDARRKIINQFMYEQSLRE